MTRLLDRLTQLIEISGPISVATYMAQCLYDPADGYYTNREPFGTTGDFVTAPEISQMFGELVAVWLHAAWTTIGSPRHITLVEIGPGRGTLMTDIARTLRKIDPHLFETMQIALVEISPRLRAVQKQTLASVGKDIAWHETIDTLPAGPVLVVGNEIFDAIPIRQFVRTGAAWRERAVGLDEDGALRFVAGAGSVDLALLPAGAAEAPDGSIVEIAPARSALMATICERIATHGGAGLFIDYGYAQPAMGDTLQALRAHRPEDVLANPGEADLTTHVDFAALAAVARAARLETHLMNQGDFLLGLGLLERAGSLGAQASEAERDAIRSAVERLAGPDAMGELFKVMAIGPSGIALPPFPMRNDTP